jgi:hypothetical protein
LGFDDALRAAKLHARLGDRFGEGQALLRAGSARLLPGDGNEGEAFLLKAQTLLKPFGASKSLARCLNALASAHLLAGEFGKAKQLHEDALAMSPQMDG